MGPDRLAEALASLRRWAEARGLQPVEVEYVARARDRRPLRFTAAGDPAAERAYRTHWLNPELSPVQRERMVERQSRPPDLVVIWPLKDWTCAECAAEGDGLLVMEGGAPRCLACADLDHLVHLPAGDAALTRRAKKASGLSAVVVRWSRTRKRYERQGLLVEEPALERAEPECLSDADARARRREREDERRARQDLSFQADLAAAILRLYPGCPPQRAEAIARLRSVRRRSRTPRQRVAPGHSVQAAQQPSVAGRFPGASSYMAKSWATRCNRRRILPPSLGSMVAGRAPGGSIRGHPGHSRAMTSTGSTTRRARSSGGRDMNTVAPEAAAGRWTYQPLRTERHAGCSRAALPISAGPAAPSGGGRRAAMPDGSSGLPAAASTAATDSERSEAMVGDSARPARTPTGEEGGSCPPAGRRPTRGTSSPRRRSSRRHAARSWT